MQLTLKDDLPFVTVRGMYRARQMEITDVLIDTGSASTILAADAVAQLGIVPELDDILHVVRGVGGSEVVFSRKIDRLEVGGHGLEHFEVEVGGMDYGFEINGILGMDFLIRTRAIIDLNRLELLHGDDRE